MPSEADLRRADMQALGWDEARIGREVAGYREYLARMHLLDTGPR